MSSQDNIEEDSHHSLRIDMFGDMVESIEFSCDNSVFSTLVCDGNIQGDCPNCGRDFTTVGAGACKVIM